MPAIDLIAPRAHDPVTLKTYSTVHDAAAGGGDGDTHVHRQLPRRVRGHVALAPAAQRVADPDLHGLVGDEMTWHDRADGLRV